MKNDTIMLNISGGRRVFKSDYVRLKTKDLREFGYASITEKEVEDQVDKLLNGSGGLTVIGLFCKDDIIIND